MGDQPPSSCNELFAQPLFPRLTKIGTVIDKAMAPFLQ